MFERYTERARRVLFFARYEASQIGSTSIELEHLLLGMVREAKGIVSRLFARSHVPLEDIRLDIEQSMTHQRKFSTSVEILFSADTMRALKFAAEEADRLLHNYIGTEHLLLGLMRCQDSATAQILSKRGMTLEPTREAIVQLLNERSPSTYESDFGAEVTRQATAPYRANFARVAVPGTFAQIHIVASGNEDAGEVRLGDHFWTSASATLSSVLQTLCECEPNRLEIEKGLDEVRHNYVMETAGLSGAAKQTLLLEIIKAHFKIAISRERRAMEVYVLESPDGPGPDLQRSATVQDYGGGGAGITASQFGFEVQSEESAVTSGADRRMVFERVFKAGPIVPNEMSFSGTMNELANFLEAVLGKPVVNESGIQETYDIRVSGPQPSEAFFEQLRTRFGLALTEAVREVEVVVVKRTEPHA
jgi:uncharacterized protein (TIGR03435 family)